MLEGPQRAVSLLRRATAGLSHVPRGALASVVALVSAAGVVRLIIGRKRRGQGSGEPCYNETFFDRPVNRSGTLSVKHFRPFLRAHFGDDAGDCTPMWVADMDLPGPQELTRAVQRRAAHPIYGYTYADSDVWQPLLRWLRTRYGWVVAESEVVFSPTVVASAVHCVRAFSAGGDGVVVFTPLYTPLQTLVLAEGRRLVVHPLTVGKDGLFAIDWALLEAQLREARLLLWCHPHNPGGRVWRRDELLRLMRLCEKSGVLIISDEVHCDLTLRGRSHIPLGRLAKAKGKESWVVTLGAFPFRAQTLVDPSLPPADRCPGMPTVQELRRKPSTALASRHRTSSCRTPRTRPSTSAAWSIPTPPLALPLRRSACRRPTCTGASGSLGHLRTSKRT